MKNKTPESTKTATAKTACMSVQNPNCCGDHCLSPTAHNPLAQGAEEQIRISVQVSLKDVPTWAQHDFGSYVARKIRSGFSCDLPSLKVSTKAAQKQTCNDVIDQRLTAQLAAMFKSNEEAQREEWERMLSVERLITFKVELSWGGPADWFELTWAPKRKEWVSGAYVFQDSEDWAQRTLSTDQVERIAEFYGLLDFEN